jgi:hypothetical protein
MEYPIVFETNPGTRRGEKALVGLVGCLLVPMLLMLSAMPGVLLACMPGASVIQVICGIAALIVLPLALLRTFWRATVARLRFQVAVHPDRIEIGRGLARRVVASEDVDLIAVVFDGRHTWATEIRAGAFRALVFMAQETATACGLALQTHCRNAVFIDAAGVEHFPAESSKPIRNLLLVERRCFWRALGLAALVPIHILLTVYAVIVLVDWANGVANPGRVSIGMLIAGFLSPVTAWRAWVSYTKYRSAREARLAMEAAGKKDEDARTA